MATNRLLGLPPITSELKSTAPYLQRADELKSQDPVMAYWCAYYAAQLGISLKAKDNPSRDVLFNLLGVLERMKKEIGSNDAIDMEAASSAYVENFALGVFAMADNEDRAGNGNRSTAKKFLAAANFLEVLKTFPKSEVAESNEEKIRYARWKAADIAKAFREGRKPTPGPAGQPQELSASPPPPPSNNVRHPSPPSSSSRSPPQTKRASPPTHIDIARTSPLSRGTRPQPQTPPRSTTHLGVDVQGHAHLGSWGGEGEATPGSWSTAATPGTGQPFVNWEQVSPTRATNGGEKSKRGHKPRSGSLSSTETARSGGSGGTSKKKAWVSEELDPQATNQHYPSQRNGTALNSAESGNDGSKKFVHFTPSVVGGLSSDGGLSPIQDEPGYPSVAANWPVNLSTSVDYGLQEEVSAGPPHGFVPDHPSHSEEWTSDLHPSTHITPPSPPQQPSNAYHSPPQPQVYHISAPQPVYAQSVPTLQASAPPAPVELELSPSIIAKAQKHCRFAISALDYEDAAQAKKELRAALAALGG